MCISMHIGPRFRDSLVFGNRDPHGRARGVHRRCRRRPQCAIQAVIRSGGRRLAIDTSERAARNESGSKAGRRRGH